MSLASALDTSARSAFFVLYTVYLLVASPALGTQILQINDPWSTTGSNTGTVGAAGTTATSATDKWNPLGFIDENGSYTDVARYGPLALASGSFGDFLNLRLEAGDTDLVTIVFDIAVINPTFFIGDIDRDLASVTVSPGGTTFTSNTDASWSGDTLSAVTPAGIGGAGAVQYLGTFAAGTPFTFSWDYTSTSGVAEGVVIGIAAVPEPASAILLVGGLACLACRRQR